MKTHIERGYMQKKHTWRRDKYRERIYMKRRHIWSGNIHGVGIYIE